ncbi:MAG: radical SAM protein [Deltaproteobacteria bacterium]|nr:radical SAM protein [Deltaproteobacteria bacterium]
MEHNTGGGSRAYGQTGKKLRFAASFLRRRMVHTNLQLLFDCNMRCEICDFWGESHRTKPSLSLAQIDVISEKLALVGPQIVSVGGGEPLLHPDIVPIVRSLNRFHFPVMICNGFFVTPKNARALFEAGMYEISVSVDYADPDRHDKQRGLTGAHERAMAALLTLQRSRVAPYQRVHMISVVMDDNLDEMEPLIRLCRDIGITYVVTLYSDARGTKATRSISPAVSERLIDLKRRYPEFVSLRSYIGRFSSAVAEGGVGPCHAGKNMCNIDSAGDVSLCIDRMDDPIGNILTGDVFELMAALRAKYDANTCRGCWTSCRGCLESLMYGGRPLANMSDYKGMTRDVPLVARAS